MNSTRMHVLLGSLLFAFGGFGPNAQASAVLELIPDNTGPYFGGESLTVDVWLHNDEPWDAHVWRVQLDFADSDPTLNLSPTFTFDLSSSTVPEHFQIQPDLPVPWARNHLEYICPPCRLQLPGDGSLHVGNMGVLLPSEPGTYVLDALNADDPLWEHGALLCLEGCYPWRAHTGEITGGVYDFEVIPEPTTLSLLMLGAGAVAYKKCQDHGQNGRILLARTLRKR